MQNKLPTTESNPIRPIISSHILFLKFLKLDWVVYRVRKSFGKKLFLVFPWTFSTDKRARFPKIELLYDCFAFLNAGGDSSGEDLRHFYLPHQIIKTVDSVAWNEEFSDLLSIAYETFIQNTTNKLVRMRNTLFLSIDCLGIYDIVKHNF